MNTRKKLDQTAFSKCRKTNQKIRRQKMYHLVLQIQYFEKVPSNRSKLKNNLTYLTKLYIKLLVVNKNSKLQKKKKLTKMYPKMAQIYRSKLNRIDKLVEKHDNKMKALLKETHRDNRV